MPDEIQDGQAESSTATEEQDLTETAPGGEQPEVDPETGVPFSEHPRWKEVYGSLKEFKALGASPEELKEALDRLAYYDRLSAEARQETKNAATPTAEQQAIDAKRQEALATLEQLIPGISTLPEFIKHQGESLRVRAEEELTGLMTKAGMPTKEKDVLLLSQQLQTILTQDKKLGTMYYTDPAAAVRGAWKQFVDTVVAPLSRSERAATQQKGASLSSLPRAGQGGGGGSPGVKGAAPPQTIDELFKQSKGLLIGKE